MNRRRARHPIAVFADEITDSCVLSHRWWTCRSAEDPTASGIKQRLLDGVKQDLRQGLPMMAGQPAVRR
jgi:hypothetical protein